MEIFSRFIIYGTSKNIFMELEKKETSELGQWVPHILAASQLLQRDALCRLFESKFSTETFLTRIIISDEKLVPYNKHPQKKKYHSSDQEIMLPVLGGMMLPSIIKL